VAEVGDIRRDHRKVPWARQLVVWGTTHEGGGKEGKEGIDSSLLSGGAARTPVAASQSTRAGTGAGDGP